MIVRGHFEHLSLAVYGTTVRTDDRRASAYEPKLVRELDHAQLPPTLNPSNSRDPTVLAKSLLPTSDAPISLELIIRLMFCLKPANEDWEKPAFPHLYSALDELDAHPSIEFAIDLTARPSPDNAELDSLKDFASNVAKILDAEVCA
jgi:hypothetical protein